MAADLDLNDVAATSPLAKRQLEALWKAFEFVLPMVHLDIRDRALQIIHKAELSEPDQPAGDA